MNSKILLFYRITIAILILTFISGCAVIIGTKTSFTPWRGDTLYQGKGGAVVVFNGIEFWSQGESEKKHKVIGLISQTKSDDSTHEYLFGDFDKNKIVEIVKREGGDGVITMSSKRFLSGYSTHSTINGASISADYSKSNVLAVFKYIDTDK